MRNVYRIVKVMSRTFVACSLLLSATYTAHILKFNTIINIVFIQFGRDVVAK